MRLALPGNSLEIPQPLLTYYGGAITKRFRRFRRAIHCLSERREVDSYFESINPRYLCGLVLEEVAATRS